MPPTKKSEAAFMGMMERFLESHASCDCSDCRLSTKKLKKFTSQMPKPDMDKENSSPSTSKSATAPDRYLCAEHRPPPPPRRISARDKDKDKDKAVNNANVLPTNRAAKVNKLLKADSVAAIFEVFREYSSCDEENKLASRIQEVTSQSKLFAESKAKIIELCNDDSIELDIVFGLLAKFRQERSIIASALIKSNSEREKALQAIHEVNDLLGMLRDVAKDGKGPSGDDMRHSLGNMIFKVHELAKNPSSLYDELMDLREEHLELLADYDDLNHRFHDIEGCHEKLHEDKKKLQDDIAFEKREHSDTRKRLGALVGTKNQVNQAHKSLEKVHEENSELKKEVEKLNAELGKVNALKHENTQLKKKLAVAESQKPEPKVEEKTPEPVSQSKKKKGKKGGAAASESSEQISTVPSPEPVKPNPIHEKELKALQHANAELQGQLDTAQTKLRQLEVLLKKVEVAKTKALEKQQVEQATAENWKELSEGHLEESNRLREQLDESMSHASTLQNSVHRLEQSLAETKDQLRAQAQKRSSSPSMTSQTSNTSRFDNESVRMLRKVRCETAQLVQDLDTAKNYPGDPWNLVECTRNMVAAIEQDIEGMLLPQPREPDTPNPTPDTYLPFSRNDLGLQTPTSLPRGREATPPLSAARPQNSYARPLLPPGLTDPSLGRASPKLPPPQHLPSPIGTGRPGRSANGLTPSPTQSAAKTVSFATASNSAIGGSGIGNGGVDWSIWTKR
ncbi:hypothetical protein PMZ80_007225 [Knufia obscura]|uniref:Uncharacterized protein n=1 Tax=Knufia obscura TaxID=1635080 RepID=A0ABR0RKP2_9EURO|nr:hypothetical protein PMZ80_007225 [Knufia obscura]